jgi:1-acyl-sn-glycerol-3-phosphate acyltransferase
VSTPRPSFARSALFNLAFFSWSMLMAIVFAPMFILSSRASVRAGRPWAAGSLWLAEKICGITYEVRGVENITYRPVIYASKHQSAWDTVIFLVLFRWPAYVLKKELLRIPLWGWYLWRMRMIAIDRKGKGSSIKRMIMQSKDALYAERPIVIFPEGTRKLPGAEPQYHPGVVALYNQLHVSVVPVALNSGVYWSKNAFFKRPGKIVIEFLPALDPGLEKKEFAEQLQNAIETASQKLLNETQGQP